MSSSGYSSTLNAEYYPVNTDTMDTEDYELYDPRIHTRPRLIQPRVATAKVKPKEVFAPSDFDTLLAFLIPSAHHLYKCTFHIETR